MSIAFSPAHSIKKRRKRMLFSCGIATRRRRLSAQILLALALAWMVLVWYQHRLVSSMTVQQPRNHLVPVLLPATTTTTVHKPDNTFNHLPVWLDSKPLVSSVRCLSHHNESSSEISWMFRSCEFHNLCFHAKTRQYALFGNHHHLPIQPLALGGINPRWDMGSGPDRGSWKVKWFPDLLSETPEQYYRLDNKVVFMPFHSFAGHNVGHLLWDDLYPLYRLAQLFGLDNNNKTWFLLRIVLNETLYASCDVRRNKRMECAANFAKFVPLLQVDPNTVSSDKRTTFGIAPVVTEWVCAATAVAGLGMLDDHGMHDHGWERQSSWMAHNTGKGRGFADFSTFVVQNFFAHNEPVLQPRIPFITFSILSSKDLDRRVTFERQIQALQQMLSPQEAKVLHYTFWSLTLVEQMQVARRSSVFVSTCGGSAMTATFLPRGSSLILFYNATGGLDFDPLALNGQPARLDWDLLNNAPHLRVHWLPLGTMETDLDLFVALVQHELLMQTREP